MRKLLLAMSVFALTPMMSSCIGADSPVGGVAVQFDEQDRPVVYVETCGETVAAVDLAELNLRDVTAEDPIVGSWTNDGNGGLDKLTIGEPEAGWRVAQEPGVLDAGARYSVLAAYGSIDNGATSATFSFTDLERARLRGKDVLVTFDQEFIERDAMKDRFCS